MQKFGARRGKVSVTFRKRNVRSVLRNLAGPQALNLCMLAFIQHFNSKIVGNKRPIIAPL
jgi:hypothetical protein